MGLTFFNLIHLKEVYLAGSVHLYLNDDNYVLSTRKIFYDF